MSIRVLFICHGKLTPKWQKASIYQPFGLLDERISHTFPTYGPANGSSSGCWATH